MLSSSTASKHLDYLDGWRGGAIGLLLLGHFFPVAGINLGALGVNFFFVLSGWLMTRLLFVQHTPVALFYKRRISRVFPSHYFFLAALLLWWVLSERNVAGGEVLAALLFATNYFMDSGPLAMPIGHIWTLSVEEHSYVVLSLIAFATRRNWIRAVPVIGCFCIFFMAIGTWYWLHWRGEELEFGKWPRSEVSAFGIFVSGFFMLVLRTRRIPKLPWFTVPLLCGVAMALHWWSVPLPVRTFVGVSALALAVNLLGDAPPRLQSIMGLAALRQLGQWSFSIYLWQQPFYMFSRFDGWPDWLACGAAILVAVVCHYVVERPMRSWLNRTWAA